MSEKGRSAERKEFVGSKRMAKREKLGRVERRVDCRDSVRDCLRKRLGKEERLSRVKKRGRGRGNRGNREVETAGRESTQERKGKGRIR